MELTYKEKVLVDRVIQHIKEFDPQAVVKIANDTLEHEDILLLVYTDKPTLETALVPFRVPQPSFYMYAVFCIKKRAWSAKPWSRIPKATAGTGRVGKCPRPKFGTRQ